MDKIGFSTNSIIEKKYKGGRYYTRKSKLSLYGKLKYFNSVHNSEIIELCFDSYTELMKENFNKRTVNLLSKYKQVFILAPWKNNFVYNQNIKTEQVAKKLKKLINKIDNFEGVVVIKSDRIVDLTILGQYNLPIAIENNENEIAEEAYLNKFESFAKKYKIVFNLYEAFKFDYKFYFARQLLNKIEKSIVYVKPNSIGINHKYYLTYKQLKNILKNPLDIYSRFTHFFSVPLIIDYKHTKDQKSIEILKKEVTTTYKFFRYKPPKYNKEKYYVNEYKKLKKESSKLKLIRNTFYDIDNRSYSFKLMNLLASECKTTDDFLNVTNEIIYLYRNLEYAEIYINNAFELAKTFDDLFSITYILSNNFLPISRNYLLKTKFFLSKAYESSVDVNDICEIAQLVIKNQYLNEKTWVKKMLKKRWDLTIDLQSSNTHKIIDYTTIANCWFDLKLYSIEFIEKKRFQIFMTAKSKEEINAFITRIPKTYKYELFEKILIKKAKNIKDVYVYVNFIKALLENNIHTEFANLQSVLIKTKFNTFRECLYLAREYKLYFNNKALAIEMVIKAANNIETTSDIIEWINYIKLSNKKDINKYYLKYIEKVFSKIYTLPDFYKINNLAVKRQGVKCDIILSNEYCYTLEDYVDFINNYISHKDIDNIIEFQFLKSVVIKTKQLFKSKNIDKLDILINNQDNKLILKNELDNEFYIHDDRFKEYSIPLNKLSLGREKYKGKITRSGNISYIYNDVIYSLKNNARVIIYPIVEKYNDELIVVGNNEMYKLALEAGISEITCLLDTETIEQSDYSKFLISEIKIKPVKRIFFFDRPININSKEILKMFSKNIQEYINICITEDNMTFSYTLNKLESGDYTNSLILAEFNILERLLDFDLRSINGIRKKYKKYSNKNWE